MTSIHKHAALFKFNAAKTSIAEASSICSISYGPEVPEWKMEKHRFYCELPGDIWEDGYFMQLVRGKSATALVLRVACSLASRAALCGHACISRI